MMLHFGITKILLGMLIVLNVSAEVIHYRPEYPTGATTPLKHNTGNKICFLDSVWDSTGTRTTLTVADKPAPYWGCLNESSRDDILLKIFKPLGFNSSEHPIVMSALIEAMMMIHNGEEVLYTMGRNGTFTESYLRYFREEDFPIVRDVVTWLSRLLGKLPRDGFIDFDDVASALPLTIYHQNSFPGNVYPCLSTAAAFMQSNAHWTFTRPSGKHSAMCICKDYVAPKAIIDFECKTLPENLLYRVYDRRVSYLMTHELFHWAHVAEATPTKQIIGDRVYKSPAVGYATVAYGSWLAQELRQLEPWKAPSNADSYALFLLEEYLRSHCGSEYTIPGANPSTSLRATSLQIAWDKLRGGSAHWIVRYRWLREIINYCPEFIYYVTLPRYSLSTFCILTALYAPTLYLFGWSLASLWQSAWRTSSKGRRKSKHPQRHLGFKSSSKYMYLNGNLVPRNDALLKELRKQNPVEKES